MTDTIIDVVDTDAVFQKCSFCGKTPSRLIKGLCLRCYNRARANFRIGRGFDPAPRTRESIPKMAVCPSCNMEREIVCRGLCRNCYARGIIHKRKTGVFDPAKKQRCDPDPIARILEGKGRVGARLLELLSSPQNMAARRFSTFGAALAKEFKVSRERVRQVLQFMIKHNLVIFSVQLTDDARRRYAALTAGKEALDANKTNRRHQ